ncbi:hypothetical protein B0A50_01623 [Salinomyces thailandicus]|uniref:Aminoglycoside phosphotransferase domain-containing protein n=1 Tax=Salinomyces thailandicus TaxID=706561 RepID=A0A4U0UDV2_9PEZI|nr:hypothetical protein B0A50_01623 [Salinomyces thailandica]
MAPSFTSETLRQVDADSWIIGGRLLLSHRPTPLPGDASWSDGNGHFFSISEASDHDLDLSSVQPLPQPNIPFPLVNEVVGFAHPRAAWEIGNAFLKVITPVSPQITREHVTLDTIHKMKHEMQLDFALPTVIYHGEWDDRYYLILTKVPGQTLHKMWPLIDEKARQHYVSRVARLCELLSTRQGSSISGVDGGYLPEYYLTQKEKEVSNFSPTRLLQNSRASGMDCSTTFVFYHCDLGAGNILIDTTDGSLAIIDWECAGFVPREWIRTKFRVCAGMDLEMSPSNDDIPRHDWRARMQRELEKDGFPDVAETWMEWFRCRDRE